MSTYTLYCFPTYRASIFGIFIIHITDKLTHRSISPETNPVMAPVMKNPYDF